MNAREELAEIIQGIGNADTPSDLEQIRAKLQEIHAELVTAEGTTVFKPSPAPPTSGTSGTSGPTPADSGPDLFRVAYRAQARGRQRGLRLQPIPVIDADGKPLDEELYWPAIMRNTPPGHYLVLGEAEAYIYAVGQFQAKDPGKTYRDLLPGYDLMEIKRLPVMGDDGQEDPDPKLQQRFYGLRYARRIPKRVELNEADQARLDHVMRGLS